MKPRLFVKVSNVNEVRQINRTNTPLIPVSSDAPHHEGDTMASVPEAVIIDLSGMKKIISINCQHRICIVELGVTYDELQKALAKKGLTLSTSTAPGATISVVTNVLETNGLGHWNFFDPLRCMEVVWGDGKRMFTGQPYGLSQKKGWTVEKKQIPFNIA